MNFDQWKSLYIEDPELFEVKRKLEIDDAINRGQTYSEKVELGQMQFRIDGIIRKAKNPMSSCLKMQQLLFDHIAFDNVFNR